MTRYLTISGLVLTTALTLVVLSTTPAGAVQEKTGPAYFSTESIDAEEVAEIDGQQIGENTSTLTVGGLPPLKCKTITYNGEAATSGPVSEDPVTISPEYGTCHVVIGITFTATVTMNGCTFEIEPTSTLTESEQEHFLGDTDIVCPEGEAMELHIFSTSNPKDEGAATLCTYAIPAQSNLPGITFTNSAEDIVADFNIGSIEVVRTAGSAGTCGAEQQTAVYKGEATLRATNEASEFVETQVGAKKQFEFGVGNPSVLGEKGTAKLKTEIKELACNSVKYEATPGAAAITPLSIKPQYAQCTFGTLDAHVKFEKCVYEHTPIDNFDVVGGVRITTATLTINCNKGNPITIEVTDSGKKLTCTLTIGDQQPGGRVELENGLQTAPQNFAENFVNFRNKITGIEYEVKGDPTTCGKNEKLKDGALQGAIVVRAYDAAKKEAGIRVVGIRHKHVEL